MSERDAMNWTAKGCWWRVGRRLENLRSLGSGGGVPKGGWVGALHPSDAPPPPPPHFPVLPSPVLFSATTSRTLQLSYSISIPFVPGFLRFIAGQQGGDEPGTRCAGGEHL